MTAVLVVDDDPDVARVLRLELEAEGFDVDTATDGVEALARIAADRPDVVLLDVVLPELDGWGVLERLDEPAPAVIAMSGLATDRAGHYRHAVMRGAIGMVSKPFDTPKLLELVALAATLDADQLVDYRRWLLDGRGAD